MNIEVHRHSPDQPWTYGLLDQRQRELARHLSIDGEPTLLLSEVAPVITRGRRTPSEDLLCSNAFLPGGQRPGVIHRAHEVIDIDRGGLATYHGPGQWIVFPVHRLESSVGDPRGIKKIICKLLEIAAQVGRLYSEGVEIRSGAELGVWNLQGKFAAVGVHIENGILLHGLAVNGFRTAESFQGLRPCGLDLPVAFLLNEPNETEFLKLKDHLVETTLRELAPRGGNRSDR